jgi:choline dehydrogenase-like flavoprotein
MSGAHTVPSAAPPRDFYDVVIVGAGFAGALLAKRLADKGNHVLILEAGRSTSITPEGYASYVQYFQAALSKGVNSPYPENPNAGTPTPGYMVQLGPLPFGSNYVRAKGGTSLHWLGISLRMCPNDFRMKSKYGVGVDWPIGYDDLADYYAQAERAIGVSADVEEQGYHGIHFPKDYVYPMHKIPQSYLDQVTMRRLNGMRYQVGNHSYPISLTSVPVGRNSIPNPKYDGGKGYQPVGAAGNPEMGKRCEGNSSCIPICPAQAKYSALKTLAAIPQENCHIIAQAVASEVTIDLNGRVTGIRYKRYLDENSPQHTVHTARGTLYVIAAHAIETPRLLLSSPKVCRHSGQLGRNLMDHPMPAGWGLMPENIGACRGPAMTSGIESLRDGEFRSRFAAFRMDYGNWGWEFATGSPYSDAQNAVAGGLFGRALRRQLADTLSRQVRIDFLMEQLPDPGNCVTVDPKYVDPLGNMQPVINYNIDEYTRRGFVEAYKFKDALFKQLGMEDCTNRQPDYSTKIECDGHQCYYYGAGHIVGTHRMGDSQGESVVNLKQRAWEHDNLYLVGCGNMRTIATPNPTLTMAALTLWAADNIQQDLEDRRHS